MGTSNKQPWLINGAVLLTQSTRSCEAVSSRLPPPWDPTKAVQTPARSLSCLLFPSPACPLTSKEQSPPSRERRFLRPRPHPDGFLHRLTPPPRAALSPHPRARERLDEGEPVAIQ